MINGASAHRFIYEQALGPLPAELAIETLCGAKTCCNPQHMTLITQKTKCARGEAWRYK